MKAIDLLSVLMAGAITSALAIFISLSLPGNALFFMGQLIVPVGAIGAGALAGAGYYFSAIKIGLRPNKFMLSSVLFVSSIIWLIGLFAFYQSSPLSAEKNFIDFFSYFLTSQPYKWHGNIKGTVGNYGYALAIIQWLGFLSSIYLYYAILRMQVFCLRCNRFYKTVARMQKYFLSSDDLALYMKKLFSFPPFSTAFCNFLAEKTDTRLVGYTAIEFTLRKCPDCKGEVVTSLVTNKKIGRLKLAANQYRPWQIPENVSLISTFGKQVT